MATAPFLIDTIVPLDNKQELQSAIDGQVKKVAIFCHSQMLLSSIAVLFSDMWERGKSLALVWTTWPLQGLKAMSHRI